MKNLLYLQLQYALQPFLSSDTILYNNNNVPKKKKKYIYIYIYIYIDFMGFPYLIWAFGAYRVLDPLIHLPYRYETLLQILRVFMK